MNIALVQLNIKWESKRENYERAEFFAGRASREGSDIIVFPEMFNTGFSMNISAIAEDEDGETAEVLSKIAKQYNMNIIAGFAAKAFNGKKGKNIAVVFDRKGECIATYTKLHPFSLAGEDQYYTAGSGPVIFNVNGIKASIFICYDLRFPEVFRMVAKDVQAIFIIANWPSSRREHWETLLKARAIENQCYIIGVNRTGTDGNGIDYPGLSRVYGPSGSEVCCANDIDEFIKCRINPGEVAEVRARFPFQRDMRPFNIVN
ncbi:MAG: carbon-nitrogen family hydrolase [Nitrospiraceae bacterium]|nr:MAG: carbon-nitrogen family hydrolase [Nitrospiraceae bacterium]